MFTLNMIIMWITITICFDFSHVSIYSLFMLSSKNLRHKFVFCYFPHLRSTLYIEETILSSERPRGRRRVRFTHTFRYTPLT